MPRCGNFWDLVKGTHGYTQSQRQDLEGKYDLKGEDDDAYRTTLMF